MSNLKYDLRTNSGSARGAKSLRALSLAAVALAAGLGLSACVGPYGNNAYQGNNPYYGANTYGNNATQGTTAYESERSRHARSAQYDRGYDTTDEQRRNNAYGQDRTAEPDRERGWWRDGNLGRSRFEN